MKARLTTMGFGFAFAVYAVGIALWNGQIASAESTPVEIASVQTAAAPAQADPAKAPRKKRAPRASGKMMRGVPSGTKACIDHLIQMASTEPPAPYEGHPEEIINNGLLWNDPKSKCSIGDDPALRLKVSQLATEWRAKNAEKVRQLLEEIKSGLPQT